MSLPQKVEIGSIRGPKGETGAQGADGPANELAVGETETKSAGTIAEVVIRGTAPHQIIDFGIPQGIKGEKGDTGSQGPQGNQGVQGVQGPQGIQGEEGPVGPVGATGLVWRGDYSDGVKYYSKDAVQFDSEDDTLDGAWIAIGDPAQGERPTKLSSSAWRPLALRGPQGLQGVQGATGSQGIQGAKGDQGIQGATGAKGDTGLQGATGATGAKGDTGDQIPYVSGSAFSGTVNLDSFAFPVETTRTLAGNLVLTLSNRTAGSVTGSIVLVLIQGAAGGYTVTWPTNVKWSYGVKPIMPTGPGIIMEYHLEWSGTQWLGKVVGAEYA